MFTPEELNLIIQLGDIAVRAQGLNAANAVLPLVTKCQNLLQPKEQSQNEAE